MTKDFVRLKFRSSLVLLGCMLAAGPAAAGIKCWTNKDGVRECGNTVPPEYAQMGHELKSETGLTIKKQGRAKTPAEVATEREQREAAAQAQAAADEAARRQAALDRVLLDTFSSEDDLALARDGQLANIASQIKVTESHIDKLERSLDQLISEAATLEGRNKPVPEGLTADIAGIKTQIEEQRAFIATKQAEQQAIRDKFESDLARFRELRGTALTQP